MRLFRVSRRSLACQGWFAALILALGNALPSATAVASIGFGSHNTWALLVDTSRYFYNYRHAVNVLGLYYQLKRFGIPDSRIILMVAENPACNSRNAQPGCISVYSDPLFKLYDNDIEIDYRGEEVTMLSFLEIVTGRSDRSMPKNKRLDSNSDSNILVYLTGHGGNEFLKFHDQQEVTAYEIASAFHQMYFQGRYKQIFFITDTCQASTLNNRLYSPGVLAVGCSLRDENSYSHHDSASVGVAVIDKFSYYVIQFLHNLSSASSSVTVQEFLDSLTPDRLNSSPGIRRDLFPSNLNETKLMEFLGSRVVDTQILSLPGDESFVPLRATAKDR